MNNQNDIFYKKYYKYKNKYLQLSNKLGGSAASSRPKKKAKMTVPITIGEIFYIKWDMSDGTSRYYKSSVIAINESKKELTLKYSLPEDDGSFSVEIRKFSEIDNKKEVVLRQSTYLEKFSAFPPKKVRVGEDYQAELPALGSPITVREIQPLTDEQIIKQAEEDTINLAPHIQKELEALKKGEGK